MMKNSIKYKIATLLLIVTIFLSFSFKSKFFEVAKQIEIYNTLFKELNMYYVDEINPAELTNKAIKNTLKDLDPYTVFYNEQDVEEAKIRRAGEYGGIGISFYYTKKGIEIREVFKGFSADKANLKAGDIIFSVDNQSIENMEKDQLSTFLKGIPNSRFSIEIERQGNVIKKELIRDKVIINPVPFSKMINEETGYIVLTRFSDRASSEVKKAFGKLKKQGMQKLILDLRGNPGGSLIESINISNFFLPKGKTIVSTKAKVKKWSTTFKSTNEPLDLEIPIVVLINERSASASEIVSGALQDYDRAVIMGHRSFGKGLVQQYRKLTYGTQLKMTISKYYTPSGRCIQELDYANRTEDGEIPKFSDNGINEFKTAKGRTVFDGGGVLPDVVVASSKRTASTKSLIASKAIFNFATNCYYENRKEVSFTQFTNYLKKDTTFVTQQELLFQKAYLSVDKSTVSKEYQQIKNKLYISKVEEITTNKDILIPLIKEKVLERFSYKEGVYEYNIKNDNTISEALKLLNDKNKYTQILISK